MFGAKFVAIAPDHPLAKATAAKNPKLAEFAKGADVLVHECLYIPAVDRLVAKTKNGATLKKHLLDSHTSTEDVGRIAAAAGVKTLVLSHFVPGDDPDVTGLIAAADRITVRIGGRKPGR